MNSEPEHHRQDEKSYCCNAKVTIGQSNGMETWICSKCDEHCHLKYGTQRASYMAEAGQGKGKTFPKMPKEIILCNDTACDGEYLAKLCTWQAKELQRKDEALRIYADEKNWTEDSEGGFRVEFDYKGLKGMVVAEQALKPSPLDDE